MYEHATSFNEDIGAYDVSAVTNMRTMLLNMPSFNQDISSWNTSLVENMQAMFAGDILFNQDLSSWDFSSVTDMSDMFNNCDAFKQNIGGWDITAVTDAEFMFYHTDINETGTTTNYDALLNGWAAQAVQSGVTFEGGLSKYSSAASAARATLETTKSWTITDGGIV